MSKLTSASSILCAAFLVGLASILSVLYHAAAPLADFDSKLYFFREELGIYSPVSDRIFATRQAVELVTESPSAFVDAGETSALATQIYEGLTEEKFAYVKCRYLAAFLEADSEYHQSGAYSQPWEDLRGKVLSLVQQNRSAWLSELDSTDVRIKEVFGQTGSTVELDPLGQKIMGMTQGARNALNSVEQVGKSYRRGQGVVDQALNSIQPDARLPST